MTKQKSYDNSLNPFGDDEDDDTNDESVNESVNDSITSAHNESLNESLDTSRSHSVSGSQSNVSIVSGQYVWNWNSAMCGCGGDCFVLGGYWD